MTHRDMKPEIERFKRALEEGRIKVPRVAQSVEELFPGIFVKERVERQTTIVVDRLKPGTYTEAEHGFDGFVGDLKSPEGQAYMRKISGGPADVSHISPRNAEGWICPVPDGLRDERPGGYLAPVRGSLMPAPPPAGMPYVLLSFGDTFRGPGNDHYQPIHGFAKTIERADELHWLTGLAPVELDGAADLYSFHPKGSRITWPTDLERFGMHHVTHGGLLYVLRVGGPHWPR